jgi:hypothetical protein
MTHGAEFLRISRDYLVNDYVPRIVAVLHQLDDADIWWRGNEATNSIGNLVLHLRDRPAEFARREGLTRDELVKHLESTIAVVDEALARVTPDQLFEPRKIQGIDTTVMEAIYHVVEHFSTHVGQIVMLGKLRLAKDLGFWEIDPDGSARQTWR